MAGFARSACTEPISVGIAVQLALGVAVGVVAERERLAASRAHGSAAAAAPRREWSHRRDEDLLDAHPVLRERAGLVGADVGHRAQRLDRRQAAG